MIKRLNAARRAPLLMVLAFLTLGAVFTITASVLEQRVTVRANAAASTGTPSDEAQMKIAASGPAATPAGSDGAAKAADPGAATTTKVTKATNAASPAGKSAAKPASTKQTMKVSEEEFELLARMISAEATQQPYEGMVAVGAVIVNRVKSAKFPNTIKDVIYQAGQFEPVSNGWLWKTKVTVTHRKAARDALASVDPTSGAIYFFAHSKVSSAWLWSRPHKITIGDHRFTA